MGFRDWTRRALGGEETTPEANPKVILDQARHLQRTGRLEEARQQLEAALRELPGDLELGRAHWEICSQLGRPEAAARTLLRTIAGELRAGRGEAGVFRWFELLDRMGAEAADPLVEPDLRARLAEAMVGSGHEEAAATLLETLRPPTEAPLGVRIRLAKAAARARSPSTEALAADVLGAAGVPEATRAELQALVDEARADGLRVASDDPSHDAPIELSDTGTRARALRVIPAVPLAVDSERIALDIRGQGRKNLSLAGVQALAAVRIEDSPETAHVVIDLLLDSLWADVEVLRLVRLRTSEFDPRTLVRDADDPQLALGTFLSNLLASTDAHALPDAEAAVGRPFHGFVTVGEYERRVLGVGA
ncbi:MAG: hypothetical protein AAGE94_04540 [Acidobacteriota bacterium]